MALKARCPKDPTHNEFYTVAHVMQEWCVDEHGNFIAVSDEALEVSHKPDAGNIWTCALLDCGAEAIVTDEGQ